MDIISPVPFRHNVKYKTQLILHVDVVLCNCSNSRIWLFIYVYYINFLFSPVAVSFYFSSMAKLRYVNCCTDKRIRPEIPLQVGLLRCSIVGVLYSGPVDEHYAEVTSDRSSQHGIRHCDRQNDHRRRSGYVDHRYVSVYVLHCFPQNVRLFIFLNNNVENDFFWISQGKVATSDSWVGQISVRFSCEIYSWFNVPKTIKID